MWLDIPSLYMTRIYKNLNQARKSEYGKQIDKWINEKKTVIGKLNNQSEINKWRNGEAKLDM